MSARAADFDKAALTAASPENVRLAARCGDLSVATHGLARGHVQANLAIVPRDLAFDFFTFCFRNPKPCPLIEVMDPGNPESSSAAPGSDIRTDLPGYRIYRNGELVDEVPSIVDHWRDDHVAFLLGCSNSCDEILLNEGIAQRHLETEDGRISVYRSDIQCVPAGPFHGPMAVTMRPVAGRDVVRAVEITSRFPIAHGGPVHIGDPSAIGIADLKNVDWGRYNALRTGEVPVYWACGVTPQAVAVAAGIPEMITHAPGHMFVTDWRIADQCKG